MLITEKNNLHDTQSLMTHDELRDVMTLQCLGVKSDQYASPYNVHLS